MITYYEELSDEEKDKIKEIIQLLWKQTYILERKYDKRAGRMALTKEYRTCIRHFSFLEEYFTIAGITLRENVNTGVIYIQGEGLWGEKLPRLATVYLLVLKLLYDEQMAEASSGNQVAVTLGMINEKAGGFGVFQSIPSSTEMRRTIALLKRYQLVEPMDVLEELDEDTRFLIYPSINAVLLGDDIRALLNTFSEEEYSGEEAGVQSTFEDMSE